MNYAGHQPEASFRMHGAEKCRFSMICLFYEIHEKEYPSPAESSSQAVIV